MLCLRLSHLSGGVRDRCTHTEAEMQRRDKTHLCESSDLMITATMAWRQCLERDGRLTEEAAC